MEVKKSPKADLNNKRGLMLEIGLIVALIAIIAVFSSHGIKAFFCLFTLRIGHKHTI